MFLLTIDSSSLVGVLTLWVLQCDSSPGTALVLVFGIETIGFIIYVYDIEQFVFFWGGVNFGKHWHLPAAAAS